LAPSESPKTKKGKVIILPFRKSVLFTNTHPDSLERCRRTYYSRTQNIQSRQHGYEAAAANAYVPQPIQQRTTFTIIHESLILAQSTSQPSRRSNSSKSRNSSTTVRPSSASSPPLLLSLSPLPSPPPQVLFVVYQQSQSNQLHPSQLTTSMPNRTRTPQRLLQPAPRRAVQIRRMHPLHRRGRGEAEARHALARAADDESLRAGPVGE